MRAQIIFKFVCSQHRRCILLACRLPYRVTILASCNMDLRTFPHDTQNCFLTFGSCKLRKNIFFKRSDKYLEIAADTIADTNILCTGKYVD